MFLLKHTAPVKAMGPSGTLSSGRWDSTMGKKYPCVQGRLQHLILIIYASIISLGVRWEFITGPGGGCYRNS